MKKLLLLLLPLLLALPAGAQTITRAEYFFDTDPGFNAGTNLLFSPTGDTVATTTSIALPALLKRGKHTLFVRSQVTQPGGKQYWSLRESASFYVKGAVATAEYFFDTDPGFGLGTPITIPTAGDSIALTSTISVAALSAGKHTVFVRTKTGDGVWSLKEARSFYKEAVITTAEYFFDADPGLGLGTALAVPASSDSVSLMPTIAVAALSAGNHMLYVRTKNDKGTWSLSTGRQLYKTSRLVAAEAFWDTDPGFGAGIALPVDVPSDTIALTSTITVPCLTAGSHMLYVRTRDERGLWSIADSNAYEVVNPTIVATAAFPGPGPTGTPLKVAATGGLRPYTFSVNGGTALNDSIFLVPNGMAAAFTATDNCGYSTSGGITTPVAPTAISAPGGTAVSQTIVFIGWRAPVYFQDGSNAIIGYLNDNGHNLGAVTLRANTNTGTVRQFGNGKYYLDRNWVVEDTSTLTTARALTLFGTTAELTALQGQDPAIVSVADLKATRYDGLNQDLLETNNNYTASNILIVTPSATGSVTGGFTVTLTTNSFSEFYLSSNSGIPLPLEGLRFGASLAGKTVALHWSVQQEEGVLRYTPQRLAGSEWQNLESQTAQGKASATYAATDEKPETGANRYRLQVTHSSGRETFSPVVTVIVAGGELVVIAPNPAQSTFFIQGLRAAGKVVLRNMLGQEVYAAPLASGDNKLDVAFLPAGNYGLQIVLADGRTLWGRLVLVK